MRTFILLSIFFLAGCELPKKQMLEGTYINHTGGLINDLVLRGNHATFMYFFLPQGGKYEIDEGYLYIHTNGDLGMLSFKIISSGELEGEGWATGRFIHEDFLVPGNKTLLGLYKTTEDLNLRKQPSVKSEKISTLKKETIVKVTEIHSKDWFKVTVNGKTGYVAQKYLMRK